MLLGKGENDPATDPVFYLLPAKAPVLSALKESKMK